jgi:hypothetical protein
MMMQSIAQEVARHRIRKQYCSRRHSAALWLARGDPCYVVGATLFVDGSRPLFRISRRAAESCGYS